MPEARDSRSPVERVCGLADFADLLAGFAEEVRVAGIGVAPCQAEMRKGKWASQGRVDPEAGSGATRYALFHDENYTGMGGAGLERVGLDGRGDGAARRTEAGGGAPCGAAAGHRRRQGARAG